MSSDGYEVVFGWIALRITIGVTGVHYRRFMDREGLSVMGEVLLKAYELKLMLG